MSGKQKRATSNFVRNPSPETVALPVEVEAQSSGAAANDVSDDKRGAMKLLLWLAIPMIAMIILGLIWRD